MTAGWMRHAAGVLVATLVSLDQAGAHGGTYYGPGSTVPTGYPMGPTAPTGPVSTGAPSGGSVATGGPSPTNDSTSWQTWWALNRAGYLELRTTLQQAALATGGDDAFFGLNGTFARDTRPTIAALRDRVRPVLLAALQRERNPDVLTGALLALAKVGDEQVDPEGTIRVALRGFLGHSNQEVAESATIGLGILGDAAAAPWLASLLRDDEAARRDFTHGIVPPRTRAFAAYALGLLGQRRANPDLRRYCAQALCTALADEKLGVQDVRVGCVLGLGLLPVLPERLSGGSGLTASVPTASRADQIAWLQKRLDDPQTNDVVRAPLPVSLARLVHDARPELAQDLELRLLALLDRDARTSAAMQQAAVTALGLLGDNDEDPNDRRIAETLRSSTGRAEGYARRLAYIALARTGAREGTTAGRDVGLRNARNFLLGELASENGQVRPWAGLALGILEHARLRLGEDPSPETTSALRATLAKRDGPAEAGAYCLALGLCRDTAAREAVEAIATRTSDDDLQAGACLALGLIGEPASVEPLRRVVAASRHRPIVLRDASIALGLLGDHELVPLLVSWLRDAPNLGQLSATASALGWLGDQRAIEPLCELVATTQAPDRARVRRRGLGADRRKRPPPLERDLRA
ncbi:MAG: HEAT repeat domain-containing protein [Planctomycetes bacterium]|nr:HEAT repeat domain-containing protein [Planctomycetota bacterium]